MKDANKRKECLTDRAKWIDEWSTVFRYTFYPLLDPHLHFNAINNRFLEYKITRRKEKLKSNFSHTFSKQHQNTEINTHKNKGTITSVVHISIFHEKNPIFRAF